VVTYQLNLGMVSKWRSSIACGAKHTDTHIRLISRVVNGDSGNTLDGVLDSVYDMGHDLNSLSEIGAFTILVSFAMAASPLGWVYLFALLIVRS